MWAVLILALPGIFVTVVKSGGDLQEGTLYFEGSNPYVVVDTGEEIGLEPHSEIRIRLNTSRRVNPDGRSEDIPLISPIEISIKQAACRTRPYAVSSWRMPEDIFPPSTHGFWGRIRDKGDLAVFSIHQVDGSDSFWMFIVSLDTGFIYESYEIQPYEIGVFEFIENRFITEADRRVRLASQSENRADIQEKIEGMLDGPPPSWDQLSSLMGDVVVPNFQKGTTMRETFSQLVPLSFPGEVREQLMKFLAFIMSERVPREDPVDYFKALIDQPLLHALLMGHFQFVIDGINWPSYVRLMILAEQGQLEYPKRPMPEPERVPWRILWEKLIEMFPDWQSNAIAYAKRMNDDHKIFLRLPVTRSDAKRSRQLWKDRMSLMVSRLSLRVHINPQLIGLRQLLYIGAAYRWPHRHMAWISRLGEVSEQPTHLQIMLMPPTALERVKRFVPSTREIIASYRTSNLDLFNTDEKLWSMSTSKILSAVSRKSSPRKLTNRFALKAHTGGYSVSKEEASVLDLVSRTLDLSVLESTDMMSHWGIKPSAIRSVLSELQKKGILEYNYEIIRQDLISIFIIAEGEIGKTSALVEGFLSHTPTTLAMLTESNHSCVIMTRVPETEAYTMASELPILADENGVKLRIMKPRAVRIYSHNLYQRLLKDDGTWDDDVSAFLSQARSKRRELSESNA
jgi:hypothetical protein